MHDRDRILNQARGWMAEGRGVALATVVATWGSSPRPVGSLLAVADDSRFDGSVSGGCVEAEVITAALECMSDGRHRLLDFGVSNEQAWQAGLTCGGEMRVLVQPLANEAVAARLQTERPLALVSDLETGAWASVGASGSGSGPLSLNEDDIEIVRACLDADRSGVEALSGGEAFVLALCDAWRLIVVGAVHTAQALAPMARLAGWDVVVVDPRRAFATPERFPDTRLSDAWPDEALAAIGLGPRTAVVTLVHDPKIDDPALVAALGSPAFYVGALGSRRTHAKRLERLAAEHGFDAETLARIRGPVGLDLGGRTPPEIAVSVLAEVIAVRHGKEPRKEPRKEPHRP